MADTKLSALAAATSVDYLYGISGGVSKKITPAHVGGLVQIGSSATISSPVDYIDLALPAGYTSFKLELVGLEKSGVEQRIDAAFSFDSGSTWLGDEVHFDTYAANITKSTGPNGVIAATVNNDFYSMFPVTLWGILIDASVWIFPGSASVKPRACSVYQAINASFASGDNEGMIIGQSGCWLNPNATSPPPTGRATNLRLMFTGDGPTAANGDQITAGSVSLFGIPA